MKPTTQRPTPRLTARTTAPKPKPKAHAREVAGYCLRWGAKCLRPNSERGVNDGGTFVSTFDRSAFDIDPRGTVVRATIRHEAANGLVVAVVVTADEVGLWARSIVSEGPTGDEVLEAARAGQLGWSIGSHFLADDFDNPEPGDGPNAPPVFRHRAGATLFEVALTDDRRAYWGAAVTEVGGVAVTPRMSPDARDSIIADAFAIRGEDLAERLAAGRAEDAAHEADMESRVAGWVAAHDQYVEWGRQLRVEARAELLRNRDGVEGASLVRQMRLEAEIRRVEGLAADIASGTALTQ